MLILPGEKKPIAVYHGSRPIKSIHVGTKLVWPEADQHGFRSVSICKTHAAFVLKDGTFWTTGDNEHGQLCRIGPSGSWDNPNLARVPDITDARAVAVSNTPEGEGSTVLLREHGRIFSAGYSNSSTLAVTSNNKRAYTSLGRDCHSGSPSFSNFAEILGLHSINRIWHGRGQLIVQNKAGSVYGFGLDWGANRGLLRWMEVNDSYGQPLVCSDLSLQAEHFVALRSDGTLAVHGQIASWHRPTEFSASAISVLQPYADENFLPDIRKVDTGLSHLAAVTRSGCLHVAGSDRYGQLCSPRFQYSNPKKGRRLVGERIKDVACGDYHTVILCADGRVKTAGLNNRGQLGRDVPTGNGHDWLYYTGADRVTEHHWYGNCDFIPGIDDATAVYAGGDCTMIVGESGITVCGDNEFGQLGTVMEKHIVNAKDRREWIEHGENRTNPFQTNLMPARRLQEIFGR